MTNPTSNFGWQMPTASDLVTDLPADFETFGQAVDTSLADLKGGTTGQVLSKASNTDMDFTWVAQDDSNAIQNAIVDAKGDLIAASAADTPARLAVGNNGETLVADSSTATGLRYQGTMAAGKNAIINGNFDIWQRGTSFSTTGYFADRWTNNGDLVSVTASQQTSGAPDGSRYYLRLTSTANSSYWQNWQYMETATVASFWGKTVVGSMKIRRNATMSSNVYLTLQKSATVDAGSGATWTTISQYTFTNANIPTGTGSADWLTATGTFAVPNDGTANSLRLTIQYVTVVPNGSILEISQVQLELGSVPTAFTRAGGTIQGELAACQRYFYAPTINDNIMGAAYSTSGSYFSAPYPVSMRVTPTATYPTVLTNIIGDLVSAVNRTPTAVVNYVMSGTNYASWAATGATGLTAGSPLTFRTNITWSAEL